MKDQLSNGFSMEEQLLRAMSMSIYGKQIESRCRVLTPEQKARLEAAGMQKMQLKKSMDQPLNGNDPHKFLDS
jgi:hypothetical protein